MLHTNNWLLYLQLRQKVRETKKQSRKLKRIIRYKCFFRPNFKAYKENQLKEVNLQLSKLMSDKAEVLQKIQHEIRFQLFKH